MSLLNLKKKPLVCPLLAMMLMLVTPIATASDTCPSVPTKSDAAIKSFTNSIRGAEYCRFREVVAGDLNGDAKEDILIRFTVEGACYGDIDTTPGACGINYKFFLIAFLDQDQRAIEPVQVGGKGIRHVPAIGIKNKKIVLDTLKYDHGDGQCCPSIKEVAIFELQGERLVEVDQ